MKAKWYSICTRHDGTERVETQTHSFLKSTLEGEDQSKRIILATWKEVATIYSKQALDIQNNYKTDLDIWHINLGLCQ